MDSDQGKLFIGGISWETNEDRLKEYFGQYGDVLQTSVMRDKITGRPKGFGFVVFADPAILDRVLEDKHTIDGRAVEAKKALSKEEQQNTSRSGNPNTGRNSGGGGNFRTKKIFVGGLPPTLSEEGFRQYFEPFGPVTDVVIMYDQNTQRPRGFGFISFESEDSVDMVLNKTFHDLNGKQVEVKRALPKDANPGGGNRGMGSGTGSDYGASGGNSNSYDNRMDSSRYMQSQNTGGGFPPYASSGYSYGLASNGMGYGYGIYGGGSTGYGGPPATAYGNPNVTNAGYANGPPGARSTWDAQAPSGYGAMGYGNAASWGGPGAGAGSGGPGSVASGRSPGGPAGYGNQGYGYGGYSGSEGSFGNSGGYGVVGGRSGSAPNNNTGELQGSGGGYNGYGDTTGNSGYGNAGWRSDAAAQGNYRNPQASGYGGGYGAAPARQAQQQ